MSLTKGTLYRTGEISIWNLKEHHRYDFSFEYFRQMYFLKDLKGQVPGQRLHFQKNGSQGRKFNVCIGFDKNHDGTDR